MIETIIQAAIDRKASDIHIVKGIPVRFRVDGRIENMEEHVLTEEECMQYVNEIEPGASERLKEVGEIDLAVFLCGRRLRVNLFRQQNACSAALRLLNDTIPELEKLGLPKVVGTFSEFRNGLVLVTGQTGSGKSTTLAALLNSINLRDPKHIITLEDPIEYVYTPEKCVINQREIGRDTLSFANGLRAALREDPDVVLVGEMRDLDTIETALTAAETGHLVFGTIHTNTATDAVDRIVDVFPEGRQRQIRMQLSMTLKAVVSQQLLRKEGGGRVAACEIMVVDHAIRNLIREGKTPQIVNALQTSGALGSVTMKNAVVKLLQDGVISKETAMTATGEDLAEVVGTNVKMEFSDGTVRQKI